MIGNLKGAKRKKEKKKRGKSAGFGGLEESKIFFFLSSSSSSLSPLTLRLLLSLCPLALKPIAPVWSLPFQKTPGLCLPFIARAKLACLSLNFYPRIARSLPVCSGGRWERGGCGPGVSASMLEGRTTRRCVFIGGRRLLRRACLHRPIVYTRCRKGRAGFGATPQGGARATRCLGWWWALGWGWWTWGRGGEGGSIAARVTVVVQIWSEVSNSSEFVSY